MDSKTGWTLAAWREFCATAPSAEAIGAAWLADAHRFDGRDFRRAMYVAGEALTQQHGYTPCGALVYLAQHSKAPCRGCGALVPERELSHALGAPLCRACVAEVLATIDAAADERREALIEAQAAEGEPGAAVAA